jgi:hypothetical protein
VKVSITSPFVVEPLWKGEFAASAGIRAFRPDKEIPPGTHVLTVEIPCESSRHDSSVFARVAFYRIGDLERAAVGKSPNTIDYRSDSGETNWENWYDLLFKAYRDSPADFQALLNRERIELNSKTSEKNQD